MVWLKGLLLAVQVAGPTGPEAQGCEGPELAVGSGFGFQEYNALICRGLAEAVRGDYLAAAGFYEEALEVIFYDMPVFEPLPRLALFYARAGDTDNARQWLQQARWALSIYYGFAECHFAPNRLSDASGYLPSSEAVDNAMNRMCGEAYLALYPPNLDGFRYSLPLLLLYYEIADEINGMPEQ